MHTTTTIPPPTDKHQRDYIAELQACTTLMDLCLFRDKLHTLIVESQKAGATYGTADYYLAQAKAQISHLTAKGVFLARIDSEESVWKERWRKAQGRVLELNGQIAEMEDAIIQTKHNAFMGLAGIANLKPETHSLEDAVAKAKEEMEMFALSPTDHTN